MSSTGAKAQLEAELSAELAHWRSIGRLRILQRTQLQPSGRLLRQQHSYIDAASNDYLGFAASPPLSMPHIEALLEAHQLGKALPIVAEALTLFGSGGSRHITGNHPIYAWLEQVLAQLKGKEAALVFGSGYQANVGIVSALLGPQDAVFSDALNHASIIDGVRLSGAKKHIYRHRDLEHLEQLLEQSEARRRLIITDALFSMDGTLAKVAQISQLAQRYGAWLMVDEAHTGGVYGPKGAGYAHALGAHQGVDLLLGTLSKAYGALGGYVACSRVMADYLTNKARSLIFTTALPPAVLAQALLNVLRASQMDAEREALHADAARIRQLWQEAGLDLAGSQSQVIPIVVGEDTQTLQVAAQIQEAGILAVPIRPPTVEQGRARIRFTLTTAQSQSDRQRLTEAGLQVAEQVRSFVG